MNNNNFGKSFMSQHNCEICHNNATHYVTYKEFFAYLCDSKECNYKFNLKAKIFTTTIEIKTGE